MLSLEIVVPQSAPRKWQEIAIERLRADGHDIAVVHDAASAPWPTVVNAALALERRVFRRRQAGLSAPLPGISACRSRRPAELRLDFTGHAPPSAVPTITLRFDSSWSDIDVATAVAAGTLPVIEAVLDGKVVLDRAWPMIDKRESTALGIDDVFARTITLAVSVVRAFAEGRQTERRATCDTSVRAAGEAAGFASVYLSAALPRLGREAMRRLCYRHAHWRVGYRFIDAPGVAETGVLGTGWSALPDNGDRFYADPFAFQWQGRSFVFVEDYAHADGKAVISVVPFDDAGNPQKPRCVLEEPYHLSYPQVFERDGAIWMLPEASAGGKLTLYRASAFPDRWAAEAVLLEGEVSDATLLDHAGRLWLFATNRDGYGSTSDTLVVFHAPALAGPWTPHPLNPVFIDRRMARPGGAFVRRGTRIFLPVQNGTLGYGGGLGLCELLALDMNTVELSLPQPIVADGEWPYPKIHTLNRAGGLEVIDGIAAVRKRSRGIPAPDSPRTFPKANTVP